MSQNIHSASAFYISSAEPRAEARGCSPSAVVLMLRHVVSPTVPRRLPHPLPFDTVDQIPSESSPARHGGLFERRNANHPAAPPRN